MYIENRIERDLWHTYYQETTVRMLAEGGFNTSMASHAAKIADALLEQWRLRCRQDASKS